MQSTNQTGLCAKTVSICYLLTQGITDIIVYTLIKSRKCVLVSNLAIKERRSEFKRGKADFNRE